MTLKKLLVGLFSLLLVAGLAGCKADPKPVSGKVLFWHTYSEGEEALFLEEVVPLFNEAYPDIEIESVRMPYDGLKQQVITAYTGNVAPDVMRMDIVWVPEFAKQGILEEVSAFDEFSDLKDNFFAGSLSTNFYNGKYYGLPLNTNTKVAVYSKAVLAELGLTEAPSTWDEMIALARTLKASDDRWGLTPQGFGPWGFLPYFWTLGGKVTDDEYSVATGYLNSADSIAAVQQLYDYYKEGLIGPAMFGEQPDAWGGMAGGNYLWIDDGPWYFSIIGQTAIDSTIVSTIPEGKGGSVSVVGGEDLVMFNKSENKDASWTFMQFMMTDEVQKIMAKTGMIPVTQSAADSLTDVPAYVATYIEQLKTAQPRTPSASWGSIEQVLSLAIESVFRDEKTVTEALNDAATEIDALLK
ncbi:MAG: extracellular solute-binding protein [Erysipelotrichaceae bacterium]